MDWFFFIHSAEGHLSCSQFLALIYKALMNMVGASVLEVGWRMLWVNAQELYV